MHETALGRDASTGRPILIAPSRRARPMHTLPGRDGAEQCPFCPGAEAMTPPEIEAIRSADSAPDGPGWSIRAFPNRYPACRWHEVIAEGAEHTARPAELPASIWRDAVGVWRRRVLAMEAEPGVAHAFLFKNVGREAGASIAHNHSQLLGMAELPPRLALEAARDRESGNHVLREVESAEAEARLIRRSEQLAWFSPRQPKLPFETWIAPFDPTLSFDAGAPKLDDELGTLLHAMFLGIDRAFGAPAFNVWLHRIRASEFHWHFECQPRTGFLAGLELGADAYINSIDAQSAAARLRDSLADTNA